MKVVIRNFLMIFRRFRMAMGLNILGLSLAFTAFMVILMQWRYDTTFNKAIPNAERIYRVDVDFGEMGTGAICSRPEADLFVNSSSHIEAGGVTFPTGWPIYLTLQDENGHTGNSYKEDAILVAPEIADVFTFDMLEGSTDALSVKGQVLIPESLARKMFGAEPALGKSFYTEDLAYFHQDSVYHIAGVYRDFPRNSSLINGIYTLLGDYGKGEWGNCSFSLYVRLDDPAAADGLIESYQEYARKLNVKEVNEHASFHDLKSLPELHFAQEVVFDMLPKANRQTVYLLFSIAWVIILIAAINFTNFNTSLAPVRMKSVNTQRVLGSTVGSLRCLLTAETVLISLLSFLLSFLWLYIAREEGLEQLVTADLSLASYPGIVALTAVIAFLLGIAAGVYPAWYVTSFQPALVLKGAFGLSPKGRRLRFVLLGIQYVASFALVIGALFLFLQNRYTFTLEAGYERDGVLVAEPGPNAKSAPDRLSNELKALAAVEDVAFARQLLGGGDDFMRWGRNYHGKPINFYMFPVSPSFLRVMKIPVLEGRDFREEDKNTEGAVIFNRLGVEQYGLQLGDKLSEFEIAGVVPDIIYGSCRRAMDAMAFVVGKNENFMSSYAYIRVKPGTDLYAAREQITEVFRQFDADYPSDVRLFDQVMEQTYQSERHLGNLIILFSLLAVSISVAGVFSLVMFDSEYRRREIAVRKVMGATTGGILLMFNRVYIRLLVGCFVVSAPIAWYAVSRWLESFAYKTPMYGWVFLLAFLLVALVTAVTVSYQTWRVATADPVEGLKRE